MSYLRAEGDINDEDEQYDETEEFEAWKVRELNPLPILAHPLGVIVRLHHYQYLINTCGILIVYQCRYAS